MEVPTRAIASALSLPRSKASAMGYEALGSVEITIMTSEKEATVSVCVGLFWCFRWACLTHFLVFPNHRGTLFLYWR